MRGRIFISYRRDDAPGDARGVADRLARKFGKSNVFMDVDNLLAGQRFDRELDKALSQCDVLIAILGPRWVELLSRPDGDRDFVRDEISAALKRDIVVIPVLVGREGRMPALPQARDLPEEIRDLVLYQKHGVAHETFGRDTDELIAAIAAVLSGRRPARSMKPFVIGGAVALAAAIVLFAYQFGLVSSPQSVAPPRVVEAQAPGDADQARKTDADVARRNAEQARKAADEEARTKAEQEATARATEEVQKKREQDDAARRAEEEEARRKADANARQKAAEEARRKAEADSARRAEEEEARRRADADAKQAAEEARRKAEADADADADARRRRRKNPPN